MSKYSLSASISMWPAPPVRPPRRTLAQRRATQCLLRAPIKSNKAATRQKSAAHHENSRGGSLLPPPHNMCHHHHRPGPVDVERDEPLARRLPLQPTKPPTFLRVRARRRKRPRPISRAELDESYSGMLGARERHAAERLPGKRGKTGTHRWSLTSRSSSRSAQTARAGA